MIFSHLQFIVNNEGIIWKGAVKLNAKKIVCLVSICGFLIGCGVDQEQEASAEPKMLDVKLNGPSEVSKDETVIFKAVVTYGDEKVENADDVQFEIEKENAEGQGEMIEAKHRKDGIYEVETDFQEPGIYTVQSHVTAKDSHNMPKIRVEVK